MPDKKIDILSITIFCLFLLTGFMSNLLWLILIPPVMALFVVDKKNESYYISRYWFSYSDCAFILLCIGEFILSFFSSFKPNSIVFAQRIVLFGFFWCFARVFVRNRKWHIIIYEGFSYLSGVLALGTIIAFIIHKVRINAEGFADLISFRQYFTPFGHISNDWSAYLICFLPFPLVASFTENRKGMRVVHTIIFSLLFIALLMSFSRGAYVSLAVFSLLALLLSVATHSKTKEVILSLACAVLLASPFVALNQDSFATTLAMNKTTVQKRSIDGRLKTWNEAITIYHMSPVFGVGVGNYPIMSDNFIFDKRTNLTNRTTNSYLQILAERGIVGSVLYVFVALLLLMDSLIHLRKNSSGQLFFCSLCALSVKEFTFSSIFVTPGLQLIVVLLLFFIVQSNAVLEYGTK